MSDLDRWVEGKGPPPKGVQELLDAVVPPMTPELAKRLNKKVFATLAKDDRREAQSRAVRWWRPAAAIAAAIALIAASIGSGMVIAERLREKDQRETAKGPPLKNSGTPQVTTDGGAPR